jgi:putative ABC transport system substrate-binding protein
MARQTRHRRVDHGNKIIDQVVAKAPLIPDSNRVSANPSLRFRETGAVVKQATTNIPIVLAVASDPGAGLIASLARPGGNVTGISIQQSELIGKRLDLLREVVPHLRRLVIMANAGYAMPVLEAQEAKGAAQALGLEAARLEIWGSEDVAPAFEAIRGKADALYVVSDALIAANRTLITTLALSARLPTMLSYGDYVAAGGLMFST